MRLPLNIRNVALFFTILFSGFYLTRVLSLSPVYITFLIGTLVIVGYAIFNYHSIYISKASVLYFAYICKQRILFSLLFLYFHTKRIFFLIKKFLCLYKKYLFNFSYGYILNLSLLCSF